MRGALLALCLLCASPMAGAEPVEFVGYMSVGPERLFVLYDARAKESSLWMKLGQAWHGFTPESFEAKAERLTVRNGDKDLVLGLRAAKVRGVTSIFVLSKGSYELVDGTKVYSPDAKLRLRGSLISSPDGVMVSDSEQRIIAGDLVVERPNGILRVTNGIVTSKDGATVISGDRMGFTTNDGSEISGAHMVFAPKTDESRDSPGPPNPAPSPSAPGAHPP